MELLNFNRKITRCKT